MAVQAARERSGRQAAGPLGRGRWRDGYAAKGKPGVVHMTTPGCYKQSGKAQAPSKGKAPQLSICCKLSFDVATLPSFSHEWGLRGSCRATTEGLCGRRTIGLQQSCIRH